MSDQSTDVFISHNSKDKSFIDTVAKRLNDQYDLQLWLDKWHLEAATDWAPAIEKALQNSSGCAVVLGANGWGPHHLGEAQLALKRKREHPNFRVIPILLPGASAENMGVLGDFFHDVHRVEFTGEGDEEAFQRLWSAIRGEVPGPPLMTPYKIERDAKYWERLPAKNKNSALYAGEKLRNAREVVTQTGAPVSAVAQAFLRAGAEDERRRIREAQRRTRKIMAGLVVSLILISATAVFALFKRDEAVQSAAEAERNRQEAVAALEREKQAREGEKQAKEAAEKSAEQASLEKTNAEVSLAKEQVAKRQAEDRRREAVQQRGIAQRQTSLAVERQKEAEEQRDKAARRLVAQRVGNGTRAAIDGDLWGAWSWYANALQLAQRSGLDERAHRERLGGLRQQVPHLLQLWYSAERSPAAIVSPNAELVARTPDIYSAGRERGGGVIEILRVKDGVRFAEVQLGPRYLREMVFSPRGNELWTLQSRFDQASRESYLVAAIYSLPDGAQKASREIKEEHAVTQWLDGRTLALIDNQAAHLLRFRDNSVEVETREGPPDAYVSAVSADGSRMVAYSYKEHKLLLRLSGIAWSNASGIDFANSPKVIFSPSGDHLITIDGRKLAVWRFEGRAKKVAEAELGGFVVAHQFDRSGRLLLTESRGSGSLVTTFWRVENATLLKSLDHEKILSRWEFPADASGGGISFGAVAAVGARLVNPFERWAIPSEDGQRIITISKLTRSYRVWDVETEEAVTPPISHGGAEFVSVRFSKDGRFVVSSAEDGSTKLWDAAVPRRFKPLIGQPGVVTSLRFVGGDNMLSISGARPRLLNWASGRELATISEGLEQAELAGRGRMIVGRQQDRFRLWHADTLAPAGDWLSHPSVDGVAVSENGLFAVSWDKGYDTPLHVRVWNRQQGGLAGEFTPGDSWLDAACIDERQKIAMFVLYAKGGHDLIVYDLETGQISRPQAYQNFSHEGLFYSEREGSWMSFDGHRFWRLKRPDRETPRPYSASGSSLTKFLTATADGTRAVLTDEKKQIAQVIDVRTGSPLTPEFRHEWEITSAEINSEATRLLTVSGNKAHLWDITTGDALVPVIRYPQTVTASALHPEAGTFAVAAKKEVGENRFAIFVESLAPETAEVESLVAYGEVNSEQRVDAVGARLPLSARELAATWSSFSGRDPAVVQSSVSEVGWYRQLEAENGTYIEPRLYYLSKILELAPGDRPARLERAELYEIVGNNSAAVADLTYLIESGAFDTKLDLTSERIHRYCRLLLLKDRPHDAFRVLRNQDMPAEGQDGWLLALVSHAAGEFGTHRKHCEMMLGAAERLGRGGGQWQERWNAAFYAARACLPAESTGPQFAAAVALAAAAAQGEDRTAPTLRLLRGAAALRADSLPAAEASLRGLEDIPLGKLLLADLLLRKGENARARTLLSELTKDLRELAERQYGDWLELADIEYFKRAVEAKAGAER